MATQVPTDSEEMTDLRGRPVQPVRLECLVVMASRDFRAKPVNLAKTPNTVPVRIGALAWSPTRQTLLATATAALLTQTLQSLIMEQLAGARQQEEPTKAR